ncbi:sentrin-specific protease 6 [Corythoichthys intestinalis]|uniref:sentrin-specific protease 6 n=1 Tax=Corythoichthys intestinalis TaxID=161448 RepID=UPI0025A4E65F|nr:sentrin-specific protease 6 [Corythoichthys intestinalis]
MANNTGQLLHALERSEARPDGGYKHKWSFSARENEEDHRSAVTTSPGTDKLESPSSHGNKSPPLRPFISADPLRTYEKRFYGLARPKKLNLTSSPAGAGNYPMVNHAPSQGLVLQGRHFQHAQMASALGKPVQRDDSTGDVGEAAEVDNIVLTCPDSPGDRIKRLVSQKRRSPESAAVYQTLCGKCRKPCEDSSRCRHCGNSPACLPSPSPRAPLRPVSPDRPEAPLGDRRRSPPPASASRCRGARELPRGRAKTAPRIDRPIVLSSDDEADDGAGRPDNVSPRPADSAHSSPAPCGGGAEAKSGGDMSAAYFEDVDLRMVIPRRNRMKDQLGLRPSSPQNKRFKGEPAKCGSIILQCRSIRVGTLRRMVTKPVVFSVEHIQLETEGPEPNTSEKVLLRASELVRCEWCSVRKLPVLFFQTTPDECVRLRAQLNMTPDVGGQWYDCQGQQSDEKYIVLIFADGLDMKEQMILEDILFEIGHNNDLDDFPSKLPFEEANIRLVNFNKATKQKQDKLKGVTTPSRCLPVTRSFSAAIAATFFEQENIEVADLQPTFSGPPVKLMVYPPPPAKGGISVTNEDLHCLNEGEFLNDVIIDFYLKYLVLEKLKKEDSQRIHVFSSFFYRRLTQREKGSAPDRNTNLPIPKRKHNRVKTWTRHVDLFEKDFVFVPINESAHWYLAVICFPGADPPSEELPEGPRPDPTERPSEPRYAGELHRISVCYANDYDQMSDERSSCQDEGSDDGALPAEDASDSAPASDAGEVDRCKRSCILIMDSLRGPTRSTVVKTLREYLEVEWEVRKGSKRSFGKNVMKGSSPRVPQQDNFSDCGIYVLQYVESFFENPISNFQPPVNLTEWFPQQRMKSKRQEIASLILRIRDQQEARREGAEALPEVQEASGADPPPLDP